MHYLAKLKCHSHFHIIISLYQNERLPKNIYLLKIPYLVKISFRWVLHNLILCKSGCGVYIHDRKSKNWNNIKLCVKDLLTGLFSQIVK
jgi:hypothetical protein